METLIYNPLEEYNGKYKEAHFEKTADFFENLTRKSGVDIEENRETVRVYNECKENLNAFLKKLNRWRFLRVIMCITVVLIPLVIFKITPKIKSIREEIENVDNRSETLLAKANEQMLPLNRLFTDQDALNIIEDIVPLLSFEKCFSVKQEADMKINYDFSEFNEDE